MSTTLVKVLKVNCDGAIFLESNKLSIGVIVRNINGQVIDSMSQQLNLVYKSIEVEAMIAIKGLEFATELGFNRVVVEGELRIVMNGLKMSLSYYGLLISDACVFENLFYLIILLSC